MTVGESEDFICTATDNQSYEQPDSALPENRDEKPVSDGGSSARKFESHEPNVEKGKRNAIVAG